MRYKLPLLISVVIVCGAVVSESNRILAWIYSDSSKCRQAEQTSLLVRVYPDATKDERQHIFTLSGNANLEATGANEYSFYLYDRSSVSSIRTLSYVKYVVELPITTCAE